MKSLFMPKTQNKAYIVYGTVFIGSVILYIVLFGTKILNPFYVDWIFEKTNDTAEMYLGWKSFRYSDWYFPIGLQDNLAYPEKTSVVFTGAIPIAAVFFKLFSPILPKGFQYFGIWGLMDFALVGILTARIIYRQTKSEIASLFSGIFLQISCMLVGRMFVHPGLSSCWQILLALEPFILSKQFSDRAYYKRMCLLGILAAGTHPYYLGMCGICIAGGSIAVFLSDRKCRKELYGISVYIMSALSLLFLLGAFSTSSFYHVEQQQYTDGLGVPSFNLINLFNPRSNASAILREHAVWDIHQADGYLGMGAILLFYASIILLLKSGMLVTLKEWLSKHRTMTLTLFITFIIALMFAVSPRVTLGSRVLFEIPLPKIVWNAWGIFRATSRFSWILDIIIVIASITIIARQLNVRAALCMMLFCSCVQLYDYHVVLNEKKADLNKNYTYVSKINDSSDSGIWKTIGEDDQIKYIIMVQKLGLEDLYPITDFVINTGKKENNFYFARPLDNFEKHVEEALNDPDESKLFIFARSVPKICYDYDLYYYLTDRYIIGYVNEIDTDAERVSIDREGNILPVRQ